MKRREKVELKSRAPTAADEWCAAGYEECAREIAKWLKATVNVDRPIRSLKLAEMQNMVAVAIIHWIVRESNRPVGEKPIGPDEHVSFTV